MRLAVLRPVEKMEESLKVAREMGFETVSASPLAILPNDTPDIGRLFDHLNGGNIDYVVFTLSTSVKAFLKLATGHEVDVVPLINRCVTVAISPATAVALHEGGLNVDLIPEEWTSEGVVSLLTSHGIEGNHICLLHSDRGERVLAAGLQGAGAVVFEVPIYRLEPDHEGEELKEVVRQAIAGRIDAFGFSSAAMAAALLDAAELMGERERIIEIMNDRPVSTMGRATKTKLEAMGITVTVEPKHASFESMLIALKQVMNR